MITYCAEPDNRYMTKVLGEHEKGETSSLSERLKISEGSVAEVLSELRVFFCLPICLFLRINLKGVLQTK